MKQFWPMMHKLQLWDFWKHFCFHAMDAVLSSFAFFLSSCLKYGLDISTLEPMKKRPKESQIPWL